MKQRLTIFLLLLSFGLKAQIFVNNTAIGLNDGTSWANAFTSLETALVSATLGQSVWVAAGTYKPLAPAPNNYFLIADGVELYGGFAGTETSLSERNIVANATILNGDILDNDVAGDSLSHIDNAVHVIVAASFVGFTPCVIDGFTIKGGNTLKGSANSDLTRRGGGILAGTKLHVRNCTFNNNTGESGSAIAAVDAGSDGIIIEDCLFEDNIAFEQGIVILRNTPTGTVKNCVFKNNLTNRGALYPVSTVDVTIDSCLFENNDADGHYGGGVFTWQATYSISNCIFKGNVASNAAGMYVDGRDFNSSCTIDNCTFESNITTDYGGTGIFFNRGNYVMTNCDFISNEAPSSGAAIYQSADTDFHVQDCTFMGNTGNFAAAIANYGAGCVGTFENCIFQENVANSGGGSCSNGFEADVTYKNCSFLGNSAGYGGAIFTQNDGTKLGLDGCLFSENITSGTAGAVLVNTNTKATIVNSRFESNLGNTGGAISANGDSLLTIDKCVFVDNVALAQGAGINLNSVDCDIVNTVIVKNLNTGDGAGGGISNNASDSTTSVVRMVNCTVADNFAVLGGGIAQWEGDNDGHAQLFLHNCLIQNPDQLNYEIEAGVTTVTTLGGNQSSDASMDAYLTGTKDLTSTSNTFEDPDNGYYKPSMGEPAGNGGVAGPDVPSDDIEGTPRSLVPDVGAYEPNTIGTREQHISLLPMQFAPNPAVDYTMLSFEHERGGQVQVTVWNQLGQVVSNFKAQKTGNEFTHRLETANMAAGTYKVQVRYGAIVHEGTFVKM